MPHQEGQPPMEPVNDEAIQERQYSATLVASEGLGFGTGTIGVEDRLADEIDGLTPDVLDAVDAVITGDDSILIDIDSDDDGVMLDDDGCGDGREVGRVFQGSLLKLKSLVRAKVFGGAPVMATAAMIGLGQAKEGLNGLFGRAVNTLKEKRIGFGGHSDTHAHGEMCGCGAIDKAPAIVAKVLEEKDAVRSTVALLGLDTAVLDGEDGIFANYQAYFDNEVVGKEDQYSGKNALQNLLDNGKIVKELDGTHNEVRIVLNMVEGKTVDQERIRQVSGGLAQVFAVDVPRLKRIADGMYDDPADQSKALVSMVVHTLGVAGTLTKGDLPVYVISEANASVPTDTDQLVDA